MNTDTFTGNELFWVMSAIIAGQTVGLAKMAGAIGRQRRATPPPAGEFGAVAPRRPLASGEEVPRKRPAGLLKLGGLGAAVLAVWGLADHKLHLPTGLTKAPAPPAPAPHASAPAFRAPSAPPPGLAPKLPVAGHGFQWPLNGLETVIAIIVIAVLIAGVRMVRARYTAQED